MGIPLGPIKTLPFAHSLTDSVTRQSLDHPATLTHSMEVDGLIQTIQQNIETDYPLTNRVQHEFRHILTLQHRLLVHLTRAHAISDFELVDELLIASSAQQEALRALVRHEEMAALIKNNRFMAQ